MKFTRQGFQSGSLSREERRVGPAVWIFRWRENTCEGRINRKVVVGTVQQFPTKSAARTAAEPLRANAMAGNPAVPVTVAQLVKHYETKELHTKAYSTRRTFATAIRTWILPKWGEFRLMQVRTVEVEDWLHALPLANATKAKVRGTMQILFAHACRYEWLARNPITLVRQSAKREKLPDVLNVDELRKLLEQLPNPAYLLVLLTASTGLRVSEALGLIWSDIDFASGTITLRRAVVHQHIGEMKTETSKQPVPIDGALAEALHVWRRQSPFNQSEHWVFASPDMNGKQPYWPETLLKSYVQPSATRIGITKRIGWHTFRRTFATLLKGSGEDVKTVQELMRHANSRLTLDVYAQALTPAKREAHKKLVAMIRPTTLRTEVVPSCSHAPQPNVVSA